MLEHDVLPVIKVHTTRDVEVGVVCQLTDFERSRIKRAFNSFVYYTMFAGSSLLLYVTRVKVSFLHGRKRPLRLTKT